jgi:hypothetical protein
MNSAPIISLDSRIFLAANDKNTTWISLNEKLEFTNSHNQIIQWKNTLHLWDDWKQRHEHCWDFSSTMN